MKKLKLNFIDFWPNFHPMYNYFTDILRNEYEIEISENPDFLFCSVFGNEHEKYNCTKIWYTGENIRPDFNKYDYLLGYDWVENNERYLRLPLYYLFTPDLKTALQKHKFEIEELKGHNRFCNFIYSNGNADPTRANFFFMLSKYKTVDSAGKFLNNIGMPNGLPIPDKFDFQSKYKFSIAFENGFYPGYTTEKLIQAFATKTIPIYWGNPDIVRDFNTRSFINCYDYVSLDAVVDKVIQMDNDYDMYVEMLKQPIVENVDTFIQRKDIEVLNFLKKIIDK